MAVSPSISNGVWAGHGSVIISFHFIPLFHLISTDKCWSNFPPSSYSPRRSPSPSQTPSQPRWAAAQTCCCHTYTVRGAAGQKNNQLKHWQTTTNKRLLRSYISDIVNRSSDLFSAGFALTVGVDHSVSLLTVRSHSVTICVFIRWNICCLQLDNKAERTSDQHKHIMNLLLNPEQVSDVAKSRPSAPWVSHQ